MFKAFTVHGFTGHINEIIAESDTKEGLRETVADLLDEAFADWDRGMEDSPEILTEDIFIMGDDGEVKEIIC